MDVILNLMIFTGSALMAYNIYGYVCFSRDVRKHGIIERENYYKGADGHKVPTCPKEKEEMIEEALKHFPAGL